MNDEDRSWRACRDVKLGMSVTTASRRCRTTLQRRIDGILMRKETNQNLQTLSPYLEAQLVYWSIGQARLGYAPLQSSGILLTLWLSAAGVTKKVSSMWHHGFLERNLPVKTAR